MRKVWTYTLVGGLAIFAACKNQTQEEVTTTSSEGSVVSPAGDSAENRGTSLVRVVNAVPGRSLTIHADKEMPFDNIETGTVSPYREIRGNLVRFAAMAPGAPHAAGDSGAMAANTETMSDGARYTIFLIPDDSGKGVTMRVVNDGLERDSAKAQVRFVNAAPQSGELDLTVQGREDALFDDVNFKSEAGYKSIDPVVDRTLTVRKEDGRTAVATVRGLKTLEAGKSYTIVISGVPGSYKVLTFQDEVGDHTTAARP